MAEMKKLISHDNKMANKPCEVKQEIVSIYCVLQYSMQQ